jgi:hypothetical protein
MEQAILKAVRAPSATACLGLWSNGTGSFHHIFSFLRLVLRVPWRGWQMRLVDRPEEQLPKLEAR